MRRFFTHWKGPLAVTMALVLLIGASSFFVTGRINRAAEEAGFVRLEEEAQELARGIEQMVESDRAKLTLIADVLAQGMGGVEEILSLYQEVGGFFSRLELLLPGDRVRSASGAWMDVSGRLSFEREAALGAHISDREPGLHREGLVVRHYVPVKRQGETVAMLYGVIELGSLRHDLPYTPYGGQAAVYVIDGATGDFLVDTWHQGTQPGNIWALGSRAMAPGYDDAQLRQGLVDGEKNFVVFVSQTAREYLYFYYAPLGINQWRLALSVPESLVFSEARNIRGLLNGLLAVESCAFAAYIGWMIFYVRRETGEKQRQLDALNSIYDVEKLLFNAHEHQENVERSLEAIARMLPARRVAFTMLAGWGKAQEYLWEQGGQSPQGKALMQSAPALAACFSGGRGEVFARNAQEVRAALPGAPKGLNDLAAVPVESPGGALRGVLSASGLGRGEGCTALLRSMGFSYAMLWDNTRTYQEMKRQGSQDALTGLYNRNRYERDLPRIAGQCQRALCCVYMDANGLHELNNSQGHEAGDRMIRAVAQQIRERLGSQRAYRVGGDEFVAFILDGEEEQVDRQIQAMSGALEGQGYPVSVGAAWASAPVGDLEALVKAAEKRMYAAKGAYYQNPKNDRRAR